MKLLKPGWVAHDGHPIFSLDIHPDGSRFVTGGQGADTGRVVIWNMAPIINEEVETNEKTPKILCQMDNHLACVNCVRWSTSGKYLASGGDDKIVMIWQIGRYGSSTMFGSGGTVVNVEQWRCLNTLRAHGGDVLDLAWSPHDAWLASCSVDNTIRIWNALKFPELITVLHGHTGLVKGVAWDPVGKYIASQSDDKTLRVWRTLDWKQESLVTEPFAECGGTTHVLRLSWSPDGQFLVSAHAMNNSGPTARIIERDGWKSEKDFVGHRKAVTCVRFNPTILCKTSDSNKSHYFCCCAVGSRDRSMSVWLTSLKRPLVVIHDLFTNSVLDMSWSKNGQMLMACSWDGTIAFIDFEDNEIGTPLTPDEKNSFHHKMYGKSLAMTNQTTSMSTVIENPAMLKLKNSLSKTEAVTEAVKTETQNEPQSDIPDAKPATPVKGPNKQIETRTADGKRRITPCFIAPAPDPGGAPVPFASQCQPTFSSSKETKSRIVIEKIETCSLPSTTSKESNSNGESNKQILVNGFSTKPQTLVNGALSPKERAKVIEKDAVLETEKVKDQAPKTPTTPVSMIPVKRKAESTSAVKFGEKRKGRPPLSTSTVTSSTPAPTTTTQNNSIVKPATASSSAPSLHLPVLRIEKSATIQLPSSDTQRVITLELENNIPAASGVCLHKLQCLSNAKDASSKQNDEDLVLWAAVISSCGSAIAGSSNICCVACEACTLSIFSSKNGQRLIPPIILSSAISRLTCKNYFVMAITSKGYVSVWDLKNVKCLVKNESLISILPNSATITNTGLTEMGVPTISVSSGRSYIFHIDLRAWIQVSNSQDAISLCSNHHKLMPEDMSISSYPLSVLQHKQLARSGKNANRIFSSDPELQQNMTLSHLDSQLTAAHSLNSSKEYKFWLFTLVRFLVQECMEVRLRVICNDLMGPVCVTAKSSWESTIHGLKKRELLKEALLIIGSNLKLQRLFTEYHDQLEAIKS